MLLVAYDAGDDSNTLAAIQETLKYYELCFHT